MTDIILVCLVKAFQSLLRLLPEGLARLTGAMLGRLGFLLLRGRRSVAISNAGRVIPGISPSRAREIAIKCFENLGINFVEVLLFPYLKESEFRERFRLQKHERAEEALKTGSGALVLGFHYSNWEIMGVASSLLGREIVALARPLKGHTGLNDFLIGLRTATGLTIIPNKNTARDVMRLLKENRMVAFLGDQREKRSKAVWVEFFGQKVPTSKGIVALAMKTGAPVMPIYSRREGFLRYTVVCDEPLLIERKGTPMEELVYRNARRINALLEKLVTEQPEDWFLVHRRFARERKKKQGHGRV
jgi:Kdo2-lipid IVA lauroyltransferase/acyltransferase